MAVVKVLELLPIRGKLGGCGAPGSGRGVQDGAGISSVYVSEFQATVENDKVKSYRANVKISFRA